MNPIPQKNNNTLSPAQARQFLLHIFRHNPAVYNILISSKLPADVDYHYYDNIQDILAENVSNRSSISEQLRTLRWISSAHKAYPDDPNMALFIGILAMPTMYTREINSNVQLYYPTDTDDAVLNENNKRLFEYIRNIKLDPNRYRYQLMLMADRYNEEHPYTGDNLRDILLENYAPSYDYSTMKKVQDSFTVMSTINRCLGNSNSLLPQNVMLSGRILSGEQGMNSLVYMMEYNGKVPVIMKTISPRIARRFGVDPIDQLHEYLVGLKVNELRSEIANFMYTYGYSRVTDPVTVTDNEVDIFGLLNSDNHAQLYLQYISNASTIYELSNDSLMQVVGADNKSETLTLATGLTDLLNIQVLCALLYAYQKLRFKHNDLNSGNILIVALGRIMAVPIKVPVSYDPVTGDITFVTKYIYTDRLVVIIDNGRATVNFDYTNGLPLMSLFRYLDSYENSGIERDVLFYLLQIVETLSFREREAGTDFTRSKSSTLNLIHMIITGQRLPQYSNSLYDRVQNIFRLLGTTQYMTYPGEQYYLVEALINYCSDNSAYLHNSEGNYKSVLSEQSNNSTRTLTIDTVPKYYMYRYIPDPNAKIDKDKILNNEQYRSRLALSPYSNDTNSDMLWTLQTYKHANFMHKTLGSIPSYLPIYSTVTDPVQLLPVQPYVSEFNQLVNVITTCRGILNA